MALQTSQSIFLIGKQTARGTAATTYRQFNTTEAVDLIGTKETEVVYSSSTDRLANSFTYTTSKGVSGSVTLQGTPSAIAYAIYSYCGVDVTTGAAVPYKHSITMSNISQPWMTLIVGYGALGTEGIYQKFEDFKVQEISISSSSQGVVECTISGLSLKPGLAVTTLPTAGNITVDNEKPFLHTDICNNFNLLGTKNGISNFEITFGQESDPFYGACTNPYDILDGKGNVSVAFSMLADAASITAYNQIQYGTSTPANNQEMQDDIFSSALSVKYSRVMPDSTVREIDFDIPELELVVEDLPSLDFENGGAGELGFAGTLKKVSVGDSLLVEALNTDADAY